MSNAGRSEEDLLAEATTALRNKDNDRAIPLMTEVVKRSAARTKEKIANDAI